MKITAVVEIRCPRCGADPADVDQLKAQVRSAPGTFKCIRCGGVVPMPQAVRLLSVTGAA